MPIFSSTSGRNGGPYIFSKFKGISLAAFLRQICHQMCKFRFFLMNKQWLLYITDNQGNISHRNISWYYLLWNYILSSSVILNIQKQQQPILWRHLFSASQNVFSHLRVYCMWSVVNNIVLGHDYSIHSKKFVVFSCYLLRFFQIFLHSSMWSLHVSSSHLGSLWISPFNILQTTYPKFLALPPLCS